MNKQELIKVVEELPADCRGLRPMIDKWATLELIKLLEELEKVKVPQFMADFIGEQKKLGHTLSYSIDASMSDRVAEWYWDNSELFALAWIFGYEVEEEKRYLVKMKGIDTNFNFLNRHRNENYWIFSSKDKNTLYQTQHTRKELEEADFGWVFDCPGVEIEEVE